MSSSQCISLTTVTTVSVVLVSVLIVSVISTAIITSIIVWCVMRKRPSLHATAICANKGVTELAAVVYDTPGFIKEEAITTQDSADNEGAIPLKHNEAYEQVKIN